MELFGTPYVGLFRLVTCVLVGFVVLVSMERWLNVSSWFVRLAAKSVPNAEREEQIDEWLADLSFYERVGPSSVVLRALGLLVAGARISVRARLVPGVRRALRKLARKASAVTSAEFASFEAVGPTLALAVFGIVFALLGVATLVGLLAGVGAGTGQNAAFGVIVVGSFLFQIGLRLKRRLDKRARERLHHGSERQN